MIRLYKCMSCWYVFDEVLVRTGKFQMCSCGDSYFRVIQPTWINILKYIFFHKTRAIKRILEKENA